ncbi:MAG: transposase, partial [Erysipelotrichaceae bacterium]|nr:transposase [Erysipelotrichaceae bacterium]
MELDKNFSKIRDLKELYVQFNKKHVNDPEGASEDLNKIIDTYQNSDLSMFREIAFTLKTYHDNIVNSFTYISGADRKNSNEMMTRLSNGPMEGFNVLPKDL